MAKSKDTFSKKEQDKKRQQKKKEKEERKAERQANSDKGKSFEEMLAYVDENGNLSSTPPDETKRKEISLEEIEIGVRKQEEVEEEIVRTGTVTMFNANKGFGFIRDAKSGESIFVHMSALEEQVYEGNKVTFETERTPKGMSAVRVKKVK